MEITRKDLRDLYENNPISVVMSKLGIKSAVSLYRLLKKAGIEKKTKDRAPSIRVNVKLVD